MAGCLDRLGEVTENVTDTLRTHGSFLGDSDGKGQPVSISMAMRTSSLLHTPLASGPEEETRLQRRQD